MEIEKVLKSDFTILPSACKEETSHDTTTMETAFFQ